MNPEQTLEAVRLALAKSQGNAGLAKSWTQSASQLTGLTAFSLEAPAKTLTPIITPLRNEIARVVGGVGVQANWRAVTKLNKDAMLGGVQEGRRSGVLNTEVKEYLASFRAIGMEDSVTFEADLAAQGFDDVKARAVTGTMQSVMEYEELLILGGFGNNVGYTGTLARPSAPTMTATDGGGAIAANQTVSGKVIALTLEGYFVASRIGVQAQISRSNADGTTSTYGGGASRASTAGSVVIPNSGANYSVQLSTPAVRGAVAYAWFIDVSGTYRAAGISTINSIKLTSLPTVGAAAMPTDLDTNDRSVNDLVFTGLLGFGADATNGSYWNSMATGTAGTGTSLTADNAGGIAEIDAVLQWAWTNHRMGPTEMWVNAQEQATLRKKALSGGTSSMHRFTFAAQQGSLTAGAMIRGYINPYSMNGAQEIPIRMHPNIPPGTILFLAHRLPYRMSGIDNVFRMLLRREYYQLEWPLRTRAYEYGVYFDGTLQSYFMPAVMVLSNIAPG